MSNTSQEQQQQNEQACVECDCTNEVQDECPCDPCECKDCDCTNEVQDECPCDPCECKDCDCVGYETSSYTSDEVTDTDGEENSEEEHEDYDDEHSCILRGKWMYDGSKTLDEMIAALQREITLLSDLKNDGWVLEHEVQDDYAYIVKPETL
jgi:hypothetical protein